MIIISKIGTLNGTWGPYAAENQGFANVAKTARVPHMLKMPTPIRSIRSGTFFDQWIR